MLPIFEEYRNYLKENNVDLSNYDLDKLWIHRMIIRGFDKQGNQYKICRLSVNDNLEYSYKFYDDLPKNEDLETWEETYKRLEQEILEKEQESIKVLNYMVSKYPNHIIILPTSMGKDSKLTEYLVNKCNIKYQAIFNNTTCDSSDVYKEVNKRNNIEVVTPKDKNGNNLSLYNMIDNQSRNFEMLLIDERVKTVNELLILIEKELPYDICDGNEAYNIIKEIFRKSILEGYKYNDK